MIPKKHIFLLVVFLTFALLVACEPLAPAQSPVYVVVTGETPGTLTGVTGPTPPFAGNVAVTPEAPALANAGGVVNTPVPSATPVPVATALPTATPFTCSETTGRVIQSSFFSAVIGDEVSYFMYQPPCFFDTFQRYPYVILLHGTGYDDSMWVDLGVPSVMDQGIANGTLPPMVVIMPDGGALAELNNQPDGASFETLILDELIPVVEQDFCLWGSREGRALGGISRGGFWAFSIGLRNPDVFSALGGHSPHLEPDNALPEYNPLDLASRANLPVYPPRIYMDHGANDYVSPHALRMSELLRQRGIDHDYFVDPIGEHDMTYWSSHVAEYLSFYGQQWPLDVADLPSCLVPSP